MQQNTAYISVTEFYPSKSVTQFSKSHRSDPIESAITLYENMGNILEQMRLSDAAFLDMKNSNWLVGQNMSLRITDTKSFLPIKDGKLYWTEGERVWYPAFLVTPHLMPPELHAGMKSNSPSNHSPQSATSWPIVVMIKEITEILH